MNTNNIDVIGAGTMGAGIAQLAAAHGCTVHLIDLSAEVLAKAVADIQKRYARGVEKGRMSTEDADAAIARIRTSGAIEGLDDVELVIEAVVERLDVKHAVFASLEKATPPSAVLATNSASRN